MVWLIPFNLALVVCLRCLTLGKVNHPLSLNTFATCNRCSSGNPIHIPINSNQSPCPCRKKAFPPWFSYRHVLWWWCTVLSPTHSLVQMGQKVTFWSNPTRAASPAVYMSFQYVIPRGLCIYSSVTMATSVNIGLLAQSSRLGGRQCFGRFAVLPFSLYFQQHFLRCSKLEIFITYRNLFLT